MNEDDCATGQTKDMELNRENLEILAKQSHAESNTHLHYDSSPYSEQTLERNNERNPVMPVDDFKGNEEFEQLDSEPTSTTNNPSSNEDLYQYADKTVPTYSLLKNSKLSTETLVRGIEKQDQVASDRTRDNVKLSNIGKQTPAIPKLLWWDFYSHGAGKDDIITCKQGVKCHVVSNRSLTDHPDTMVRKNKNNLFTLTRTRVHPDFLQCSCCSVFKFWSCELDRPVVIVRLSFN